MLLKLVAYAVLSLAAGQVQARPITIIGQTPFDYRISNTHSGNLHFDLTLSSPVDPRNLFVSTHIINEYCDKDRYGLDCNEGEYDYLDHFVEIGSVHYQFDLRAFSPFVSYGANYCCYNKTFTSDIQFRLDGSAGTNFRMVLSGEALAVPEPAAWVLMIAGFAMIGGIGRFRRIRTPDETFGWG